MWKAKVRTGGIRRKVRAEYLRIMSSNNEASNEQSTSSVNNVQGAIGVLQYSKEMGSVYQKHDFIEERRLNSRDVDCTEVISESSDDSNNQNETENKAQIFRLKIKRWAIDKNVSQTALKDLAKIINEFIPNTLPTDPRTILATPRKIDLKKTEGGEYWHNGIIIPLKNILLRWEEAPETISLNINFDGLPIFKSSKNEFWPILCNIFENPCIRPFVVGIYFGIGKPKNLYTYLEDFITDIKILLEDGIYFQNSGRKFTIKIRCFICDSPARAYIKGVCNFNGRHGCLKCTTVGEYSHTSHTVVFPDTRCPERTNDEFREKLYGAHHKTDSPLLRLPIDMVKNFPVSDSLHLIDLGIMKRLLIGWRDGNFGKYITKWRASETDTVTSFLSKCKLPSEIHRSIRGLDALAYWKASEFRSFFYYLGIVILPDVLSSNAFAHFLTLYCGILICSNKTYHILLPLAEQLLRHFVEHYKDFYGADYVTSNVHNLLHVTAEVEMYGPLQTFSAYPFENKLFMIKRMLREGKNPLSQVAKRLIEDMENNGINKELESINKKTYPYISKSNRHICTLHLPNMRFSTKIKDRYLFTAHSEIVEIISIDEELDIVSIKGFQLNTKEEVFEYPIRSSRLGIYKSKSLLIGDTITIELDPKEIKYKLVCIPHKDYYYFIPLVHTV